MDRPLCKCHGVPMMRNSYQKNGKQKWACSRKRSAYSKRSYEDRWRELLKVRYAERKTAGNCTRCNQPALSETLCWKCLSELEARRALY